MKSLPVLLLFVRITLLVMSRCQIAYPTYCLSAFLDVDCLFKIIFHFPWQAKLQEFLGRKELDKHLDADEATVLGASLHAANISDGIKLNRKLGMIDGSMYGFVINVDGPDLPKDESTNQFLIPRMKKLPSKVNQLLYHPALK